MKLSELAPLQEANESTFDFEEFKDRLEYTLGNNEDTFKLESMKSTSSKIEFELEDRQGHRQLVYSAEVELKDGKIEVSCEGVEESFALKSGEYTDDDLSDLAYDVLSVLEDGVSAASNDDNNDD